jgi:prefoldin subunit 4
MFLFQDKEIQICLDDQQKINKFARLNNRLDESKDDIKAKKNEIQTLEDASTDIMMVEDDEEKVNYQIGEVFIAMTQEEVQESIEKTKEQLLDDVKAIEEQADGIKAQMSDLKTHLYAKFGTNINLEADDE